MNVASHAVAFGLGAAAIGSIWIARSAADAPTPPKAESRPVVPSPPPRATRSPETDDGSAAALEERAAEARSLLQAKRLLGLQFDEQKLDQIATYLRTVTGLDVFITPGVRRKAFDVGAFDDVRVTLGPLDDATASHVLDLVTVPIDLRWDTRNGIVRITTVAESDGGAGPR